MPDTVLLSSNGTRSERHETYERRPNAGDSAHIPVGSTGLVSDSRERAEDRDSMRGSRDEGVST